MKTQRAKPKRGVSQGRKTRRDRLVAETVADCYTDSEQVTALFTVITNNSRSATP